MDKQAWKSKPGHRFDRLGEIVSQYDARRIAVVEYPPYFKPGTNDLTPDAYREAEEIGALLAAAPDLLAACQDGLRCLEVAVRAGLEGFTEEEEDGIILNHGICKAMRQAIKKATVTP